MKKNSLFSASILSLSVMLVSNCSPVSPVDSGGGYLADYKTNSAQTDPYAAQSAPVASEVGYWDGDGVDGESMIKINISDQKAYFYKGGQLVGQTPISTGKEGKITPKGTFKVTEKDVDHTSSLYGVIKDDLTGAVVNDDAKTGRDFAKAGQTFVHAPMLNFLRFNGAIGMHTGYLPGYAASHGCVRLPDHMAKIFYNNAKIGTKVIVE